MYCISISHKTTPVNIRELFSFSEQEQMEFERLVISDKDIFGCVVISTCNRSEIYFSGEKTAIDIVEKQLSEFKKVRKNEIRKYLNIYSNEGAMKHLFQVTSGLDSMVLGEDEILRQVKDGYYLALNNKCTNHELNIAFQGAMNSAKLVKTDTRLSNTPVSIGTLTANKVVDYLESVQGKTVLIVGITGQIGTIVAKNLLSKNCNILGTSRSHRHELILNDSNIKMIDYKDRYQYLEMAEVIISATTSPHYTFTYNEVSNILKSRSCPKLFIDLAVPCDIDKDILEINSIQIIDIDYFEKASKENNRIKLKELDKAQLILNKCVDDTLKNIYFQEFYPALDKIEQKIEEKGFGHILFQLKESLNSEQLMTLINSFEEIIREEDK